MEHSKPIIREPQVENRFPSSSTLSSSAYDRLRQDILSGIIQPGARLHIREQCDRLGIGLSPIREALNRLAAAGFVTQSDQRGFTAAPLNHADLTDLTLARTAVNEAALRDSLRHGTVEWEEELVLAHHRMSRVPRAAGAPSPEWEIQHERFHDALMAGCRSGRLRLYCTQLFVMADRYRRLSRAAPRSRDVEGEHGAILRAALARDVDQALHLLKGHVEQTEADVRAVLDDTPVAPSRLL